VPALLEKRRQSIRGGTNFACLHGILRVEIAAILLVDDRPSWLQKTHQVTRRGQEARDLAGNMARCTVGPKSA
jgi:hypothetical protein